MVQGEMKNPVTIEPRKPTAAWPGKPRAAIWLGNTQEKHWHLRGKEVMAVRKAVDYWREKHCCMEGDFGFQP